MRLPNNPMVTRYPTDYMKTKLGIPPENIDSLSSNFYMNFGTTLAGLVVRQPPTSRSEH